MLYYINKMPEIKTDLKFGLNAENKTKPILEELFGELTKTENKYNNFDFYNKYVYVELKTRRNVAFGQYDSLIFDKCKYDKYIELKNDKCEKQFFVVWNLSDGLFMWKMSKDTNQFYIKHNFHVNRGDYTQTTRTIHVKNEFIKPFHKFKRKIK